MNEQINGYSLALYEIAHEQNKQKKFKEVAIMLRSVIEKIPKIIDILNTYELTQEKKIVLIKKIFTKYLPPQWINFCIILSCRHKFHLILPILNKVIKFLNNYSKIKEGIIYSTILLDHHQINKIQAKISILMGGTIELINKLDQSLIGGIRVVVDSVEFDYSLSARIKSLKNEMLYESGEYNGK